MSHLRSLRLSRALTFFDLAALSGIPARALAEAELGLRVLTRAESAQLALIFGVADHGWDAGHQTLDARRQTMSGGQAHRLPSSVYHPESALLALALVGTIATGALQAASVSGLHLPSFSLPKLSLPTFSLALSDASEAAPTAPTAADLSGSTLSVALDRLSQGGEVLFDQAALRASLREPVGEPISPVLLVAPLPAPQPIPIPVRQPASAPRFAMGERGPLGCPIQPTQGSVVLTQGYGVGSHAPAAIWGAVDLAVDSDGDGWAEPAASWYTPVVASHAGVVTVTLDSYPAGNHIWVRTTDSPWRTGYAHLSIITVISGQYVRAGEVIGMIGSTGAASGPHLDYQVWNGDQNIDPTELVAGPCQEG